MCTLQKVGGEDSKGQFLERPHPTLEAESVWEETPSPLSVYSMRMVYNMGIDSIKFIVLSLFLAFITLSDLYYPHQPPSEGWTFRSQKRHFTRSLETLEHGYIMAEAWRSFCVSEGTGGNFGGLMLAMHRLHLLHSE